MSIEDIPRKPLTGFFLYKKDIYDTVKEQYKDRKATEIIRAISVKWNEEKPEVKAKYEKESAIEKEKYEKAKQEFEAKYGSISAMKKKHKKAILKERKQNFAQYIKNKIKYFP